VSEAYCGLIIAVNKWDIVRSKGGNPAQALGLIRRRFKWAPYAPVRFTTAVTGDGVRALMDVALEVYQERQKHVGQGELNRLLMEAMATHPPPSRGSRHLRIFKVVQSSTNPPTFVFYVNDPKLLHFSYERFLQNTLRSALGFQGSLLRFDFKKVARRWVGSPSADS
jgi:GTP-binding protein